MCRALFGWVEFGWIGFGLVGLGWVGLGWVVLTVINFAKDGRNSLRLVYIYQLRVFEWLGWLGCWMILG